MRRKPFIYLALLVIAATVFWPVSRCDFINYDDPLYVSENPEVQQGLTWAGAGWAFRAVVASNWHPVTCLSHMLDCQLFGNDAGAHHLINLLFHVANTLLLFHILRKLTRELWPSAIVAALFALHPLHVESVAWISERKDLLSTFFGLLTIRAYLASLQWGNENPRFRVQPYLLAICFFALGLMSKPMLVTWPFVLLLLDFWPLKRLPLFNPSAPNTLDITFARSTLSRLIFEKLPFFGLAITSAVVTFLVQRHEGAMSSLSHLTASERIANALIAYVRYLGKTIWPSHLAVFYPHPSAWPGWQVAVAIALLALITLAVMGQARRRPALIFGWLWFVGTLVPVIGLVQVGEQAMADRYSYIPLIGLFVMLVWGTKDIATRLRQTKPWLSIAAVAALAACAGVTRLQLSHWSNCETLFRHALGVTTNNHLAHLVLGSALIKRGEIHDGVAHLREGLRIKPDDIRIRCALAETLAAQGKIPEAIHHYHEALQGKPDLPEALNNLAWILATNEDPKARNGTEAVEHAERACSLTQYRKTIYIGTLAAAYAEAGRYDDAVKAAETARASAMALGETALAGKNLQLLEVYRAGRPYRERTKP